MDGSIMYCDSLEVSLDVGPDIVNVTEHMGVMLEKSHVEQGTLHAFVVGSTGSMTTIEYEPGVVKDLKRAIAQLAPPGLEYAHEQAWHDGNGHSHVQAALLGPSIVIPVRKARLALGTWQQVVIINHDNRRRKRRVEVTVMGR